MKRFALLVCITALLSLPVFAGNNHNKQDHTCQGGHNCNTTPTDPPSSTSASSTAAASSNSSATAVSGSNSTSTAVSTQQQNQSQTATGGNATASGGNANASNQGNSQSTSYVNNQPRQAPMAYAPEAFSTAACRVGGSAGISAPIGGISLGGSKKDKDCERIALANGFFSRGNYVAGCKLLMHVKVVKESLTFDECVIAVEPAPAPAPVQEALQVQPNIIVNVPAPVVIAPPVAVAEKTQVVTVTAPKHAVKRTPRPCPITKGEK